MALSRARVWAVVCFLVGGGGCAGTAKTPNDAANGDVPVAEDGAGAPDSSAAEVGDGAAAGDTSRPDGGGAPDRPADAAGSADADTAGHDARDGAQLRSMTFRTTCTQLRHGGYH